MVANERATSKRGRSTVHDEIADGTRELTTEEVRERLLAHMWKLIAYWDSLPRSSREKLEGLAFSICSALDGETLQLPAFKIVPNPHPEDAEYHRSEGVNWYPNNGEVEWLHEHFHEVGKKYGFIR